jgi:lipoyl(octanoyl) transferase
MQKSMRVYGNFLSVKNDHPIIFRDLGLIDYKEAWDLQESFFNQLVEYKIKPVAEHPSQYLLFCEHPHVYTLGKSGNEGNLLIQDDFLRKIGATYFKTNRGGDITYHGPGQIVGYPILDLELLGIGLKRYVYLLEEAIILLLAGYGLETSRMQGATGVWLEAEHAVKARKICALGVRSSRHVTMHGFALNVHTNLEYFTYINPCGFETKGVTSMEKELRSQVDMEQVKHQLKGILMDLLHAPGPEAT